MDSPIDFQKFSRRGPPRGHVIAARITAENPDAGFQPCSGKLVELTFRSDERAWGYFSVTSQGGIHAYADSQFGHIFAVGKSRQEARRHLVLALKELSIRGDFRTTIEYLVELVEMDDFRFNRFNTAWLDKLLAIKTGKMKEPESMEGVVAAQEIAESSPNSIPSLISKASKQDMFLINLVCGATAYADKQFQTQTDTLTTAMSKGQAPSRSLFSRRLVIPFITSGIKYIFHVFQSSPQEYTVCLNQTEDDTMLGMVLRPTNEDPAIIRVHRALLTDGGRLLRLGGKTFLTYVKDESSTLMRIRVNGSTIMVSKREDDPSILRSASSGKLVRFLVEEGAHLDPGDAYAEVEVMKMYMSLRVKEGGKIHCVKTPGSSLSTNDVIGTLFPKEKMTKNLITILM